MNIQYGKMNDIYSSDSYFFVPAKTALLTKKESDCEPQKVEPCVLIIEDQPATSAASGHRYVNVTLQVKNDVRITGSMMQCRILYFVLYFKFI